MFFEAYQNQAKQIRNLTVKKFSSSSDAKHLAWLSHIKTPKCIRLSLDKSKWSSTWGFTVDVQGTLAINWAVEASRMWPLIEPFVRDAASTARQGSGVRSNTTSLQTMAKQRKRFDTLQFDIPGAAFLWDKRRSLVLEIEDEKEREAKFREAMLKVAFPDSSADVAKLEEA